MNKQINSAEIVEPKVSFCLSLPVSLSIYSTHSPSRCVQNGPRAQRLGVKELAVCLPLRIEGQAALYLDATARGQHALAKEKDPLALLAASRRSSDVHKYANNEMGRSS